MPTNRLEAFSDGVIAIIITIMVFDLKVPELVANGAWQWEVFMAILPKFLSYAFSFVVLAIMWINHHHILHQIAATDNRLLWLNINLLFWMSLIPFSTNFIGLYPALPEATMAYSLVFFMNSFSFFLLRQYASGRGNLWRKDIKPASQKKVMIKSYLGMACYFTAAFAGFASVYLSYMLICIVPIMYFVPDDPTAEKI